MSDCWIMCICVYDSAIVYFLNWQVRMACLALMYSIKEKWGDDQIYYRYDYTYTDLLFDLKSVLALRIAAITLKMASSSC